MNMLQSHYLRTRDICKIFNISRSQVMKYRKQGDLEYTQLSDRVFIYHPADVLAFIDKAKSDTQWKADKKQKMNDSISD